jgi:hypothetical protein
MPNPHEFKLPQSFLQGDDEARQRWGQWVAGSTEQSLLEMADAVVDLNHHDRIEFGRTVENPGACAQDVLVIACEQGKHCVVVDQPLACKVVLFDWTGQGVPESANPQGWPVISVPTECKGQLMTEAWRRLPLQDGEHYMGFVDDDISISTSDINRLLALSRICNLSAAQPALSLTSVGTLEYPWLRHRPGVMLHRVPLVEIMAPFIRKDLLDLAMPWIEGMHSGYGLDRYVMPLVAAHHGLWRFAVIDQCLMGHMRPLTSMTKRFSNGLLSTEEEVVVRRRLLAGFQ